MSDARPRYAHFFRCKTCGNRFSVKRFTPDPEKVKVPKCPRKACGGRAKASHMPDVGMDVAAGKAPAINGAPGVLAYDIAMESAAHNAGMTNIVDKPKYGESSVPKLRPDLQRQADNFFLRPATIGPKQKMITKRADLSGIFGQRAVNAQAASPIPGMPHATSFTAPIASAIVNKPGAKPPVQIEAAWPPEGSA